MERDLKAMDRFTRLTGELDCYHGARPAPPRRPGRTRVALLGRSAVEAEGKLFLPANP